MTSPGESLTGVLGPGGFGKGGSGLWQPPNARAANTRKAKRQEDGLSVRLRQTLSVPGNCRSHDICLLSCVMQRCLLYEFVDRQDKCDEIGDRSFRSYAFQTSRRNMDVHLEYPLCTAPNRRVLDNSPLNLHQLSGRPFLQDLP